MDSNLKLFDPVWYSREYPDVAFSGLPPEEHYGRIGKMLGRGSCANDPQTHNSFPEHGRLLLKHRRAETPQRIVWISGESDTPGHYYRVELPSGAARKSGMLTRCIRLEDVQSHLDDVELSDVVIFWRTAWSRDVATALEAAQRGRAQIVFDIDDLMFEPELAKVDVIDGIRSQHFSESDIELLYSNVRRTLAEADLCIAPTEELAMRCRTVGKPALVIPNTFGEESLLQARRVAAQKRIAGDRRFIRIGYAGGSRTHQRDFAVCAEAVGRILRKHPSCRLVLFKQSTSTEGYIDTHEFACLSDLENQIEWRDAVPVQNLPSELARFDINLAPLEVGNPFCECKSELKYFEAALCRVPTIASPTGPFSQAITSGHNGYLAYNDSDWFTHLETLVTDANKRLTIGTAANCHAEWYFGPERLRREIIDVIQFVADEETRNESFPLLALRRSQKARTIQIPCGSEVVLEQDSGSLAEVSILITLFNYETTIEEALESCRLQTLECIDLIVVDDASKDTSLTTAESWLKKHLTRFNKITLLSTHLNHGLGTARNIGFSLAETKWVMVLDADNRIRPPCIAACLEAAHRETADFAFPRIQCFGGHRQLLSNAHWNPVQLIGGNYIDAMALVSRRAWQAAGGYDTTRTGWEDYDLWCKFAELGFKGTFVDGLPLADYRVHSSSMINTTMQSPRQLAAIIAHTNQRHKWLRISE